MKFWILIFIGGGVGSVLRYLVSRWINNHSVSAFPYGTFLVNITGCFLIGFLIFYFSDDRFGPVSAAWKLFLVTGICGGYTTFSAFSFENVVLLTNHQIFNFLAYAFGSIAIGFLATFTGIWAAKAL